MRLFVLLSAAVLLFCSPALAADRYEFDKSHTRILFFVNHMGFSNMVGEFTDFEGALAFDAKAPQTSGIDITLSPKNIRTSSAKLDEHLQNADFFNSAKFPQIKVVSKSIAVTGERTGVVTADVTLLGVTKPVDIKVTFNKEDFNAYAGAFVAGFSAEATIKRSDFGMSAYIPLVSDEVRLFIETEATNTDRKQRDAIKR